MLPVPLSACQLMLPPLPPLTGLRDLGKDPVVLPATEQCIANFTGPNLIHTDRGAAVRTVALNQTAPSELVSTPLRRTNVQNSVNVSGERLPDKYLSVASETR